MQRDRYIVARITVDEDDYITITTVESPIIGLEMAKYKLRLIARTDIQFTPSTDDDSFDDYFNEDNTAWGPIPGDKKQTRYVIIKLDYGFYTRVLR